jgi:hypothetical protein
MNAPTPTSDLDDLYLPSPMPDWQEPPIYANCKLQDVEASYAQLQADLARCGDMP